MTVVLFLSVLWFALLFIYVLRGVLGIFGYGAKKNEEKIRADERKKVLAEINSSEYKPKTLSSYWIVQ